MKGQSEDGDAEERTANEWASGKVSEWEREWGTRFIQSLPALFLGSAHCSHY